MALLPHNIRPYHEFEELLLKNHEALLVTATGTGKTYITVEFLENHPGRAIALCPNNSIKDDWIRATDLVDVSTYQYFYRHPEAFIGYDYIILDEVHHIGSPVWGDAINKFREMMPDKYYIGLTADPTRYSDGKDITWFFHNNVVYGYSQKEAMALGILPKATYVTAVFDTGIIIDTAKKFVKRYKGEEDEVVTQLMGQLDFESANTPKIVNILRKHCDMSRRKGIVFVDSIATIEDGCNIIHRAFPDEPVLFIHSGMNKNAIRIAKDKFYEMEHGYIVAVNMYNEGVHVPGVNTTIMLRRTASPTIYMQQIGRALAAGSKEEIVIFDLVANYASVRPVNLDEESIKKHSILKHCGITRERHASDQMIYIDYTEDIISTLEDVEARLIELDEIPVTHWSEETKQKFIQTYKDKGIRGCTIEFPNLTATQAIRIVSFLNITKIKFTAFSKDEDEFIRRNHTTMSYYQIGEFLGRTANSISNRVRYLKLPYKFKTRAYDDPQIIKLFNEKYEELGPTQMSKITGLSIKSCRHIANRLGLSFQKSINSRNDMIVQMYREQETKDIDAIAEKFEMSVNTIRGILRKSGINPKDSYFIDWNDANLDILRTHNATEAAKLIGCSYSMIIKKRKELGMSKSKTPYDEETKRKCIESYFRTGSYVRAAEENPPVNANTINKWVYKYKEEHEKEEGA